jgi:hypothetical protein
MENTRPRLLGKHATRQYRVARVSMKSIVVLGMAQPYPGYGCEQVTIFASRIPDTIVAFGQTRRNINKFLSQRHWGATEFVRRMERLPKYRNTRTYLHPLYVLICLQRTWNSYVSFEVFTAVTMKNPVFWDIRTQFVLHRRHNTSPLQSPAG